MVSARNGQKKMLGLRWLAVGICLCLLTPFLVAQTTLTDTISGVSYRVEKYVNANFPVAMVFAPDGRLFYTEKTTGNVRVVSSDGVVHREPVIHLPTDALQERGMLGITLDPDYENNGMIWIYHTAEGTTRDFPTNKVVRFHEQDGIGSNPEVMLSIPIENGKLLHNGGNLHFDREGLLYVAIGDYGDAMNAQDLSVMQGKIHRFAVTDEGLVPAPRNPFDDSSIFAYGLRNPFDFTFDAETNTLYSADNGLHCDDEINRIRRGFNYGWREDYECVGTEFVTGLTRYDAPLLSYTPTEAPTGILVYNHPAISQWQGDLFFCSWNFGILRRVDLSNGEVIGVYEIDLGSEADCRIDLVVGPEGGLYFGTVGDEGGAIYRLLPES